LFTWKVETSTQQTYGLESAGPGPTVNTDGVFSLTGTHEWDFTDGREFEAILGSLVQGTGTYGLATANTLPSYSVEVVDEADISKYLKIKGLKYTKFSLNLTRGEEPIKVTADWIAKEIENTGTFTPSVSSVEPLVYLDGYLTVGGTDQVEVEDVTMEIDRKCVGMRFIENTTTNERRLISEIVEGPLSIAFNGNISAQRDLLEEVFGGATMTDVRSDKSVVLNIGRGDTALHLTVSGGRYVSTGRTLQKDQEVSLMDFAGVGLDITGTGSNP
jgi:hypothetical protein